MGRPLLHSVGSALFAPVLMVAVPSGPDATGVWSGRARVSNEWGGASCAYEGERAATLELVQEGDRVRGFASLEAQGQLGAACPGLKKRWRVRGRASGASVTLNDDAGHEWTLGVRDGALVGLLAWKTGAGRDEALAEGFRTPSGEVPLTRLSGEVTLGRSRPSVAEAPPAPAAKTTPTPQQPVPTATPSPAPGASPSPSPSPAGGPSPKPAKPGAAAGKSGGGGGKGIGTLAVIGANVLGVGAFLAVNELAQDTPGGLQNTCSPRECIVGVAGEGCDCGPNDTGIVTGADCGNVDGGVLLGATCDPPALPCATGLSCNNGVCQDSAGACPFQ